MTFNNEPSSGFEKFVNPSVGELLRRIGLDQTYVWGQGSILRNQHGWLCLDFLAAYGALPFGHAPREILQVLSDFSAQCEPNFVQPSALAAAGELAERLLQLAPGDYRSVTFQNSGAETVEAAFKACIAATGRRRILSAQRSFHGKTLAALSATGSDHYRSAFHAPLDGFDCVEYGCINSLQQALAQRPDEYAALILEPIQAEGGVIVAPAGYLAEARAACDAHGVLLIIDEVQTGLGRTGRMFAIEAAQVQADCLLLAKALGGGVLPVGACLLGPHAQSEDFQRKHSSTFGANTLACRVGIKVLELLTASDNKLLRQVASNGAVLMDALQVLARRFPQLIREVRGEGYLIGVEFHISRETYRQYFGAYLGLMGEQESLVGLVASYMLHVEHVRVAPTLNGANTLRVEPPLTASLDECHRFLTAFERTLEVLASGNTGKFLAHLLGGAATLAHAPAAPRYRHKTPDPGVARFGFVVHPLSLRDYAEFDESLQHYSEDALQCLEHRLGPLLEPFCASTVHLESPHSGRAIEGDFIMLPRSAAQLSRMPVSESCALVRQAIDIACSRGARIVGLGGHSSIVTGGGLRVCGKGVAITTGNSYTLLTAVEASRKALEASGKHLHECRVAIVGATGSIGSAMARILSASARQLTLVGNPRSAAFNRPRFEAVMRQLVGYAGLPVAREPGSILEGIGSRIRKGENTDAMVHALMKAGQSAGPLQWSNAPEQALAEADLVLVATSHTERFIHPAQIKSGCVLCDVSRPANVSREIDAQRPDVLVIDGGIVEIPGRPLLGARFGIPEDLAYACMAETMLLCLGGIERDTSLGLDLHNQDLELVQQLASQHQFRVAGLRSFDQPLHAGRLAQFLESNHAKA